MSLPQGTVSIFEGFSEKEIKMLQSLMVKLDFEANTTIIKQGDLSTDVYLIDKGEVKVVEKEDGADEFIISQVREGDIFGELSFVDEKIRSASVIATKPTSAWMITRESLAQNKKFASIFKKLLKNLMLISLNRLRNLNVQYAGNLEANLKQKIMRQKAGVFMLRIFLILTSVLLLEYILQSLGYDLKEDSVSSFRMILVSLLTIYFYRKEKIPLKQAGLTFENWPKFTLEGILLGLTIVSFFFIIYAGLDNFDFKGLFFKLIDHLKIRIWLFLYFFHSFLQEFVVRIGAQYPIRWFLNDKKGFLTIFIVSLNVAALHVHWDWKFVLSTFLGNIVIGYIYLKRNNVYETTIIHYIAGYFAQIKGQF